MRNCLEQVAANAEEYYCMNFFSSEDDSGVIT